MINSLRLRGASPLRSSRLAQAALHNSSSSVGPSFGIAFDIDGVLIRCVFVSCSSSNNPQQMLHSADLFNTFIRASPAAARSSHARAAYCRACAKIMCHTCSSPTAAVRLHTDNTVMEKVYLNSCSIAFITPGCMEEDKAANLSKVLDLHIDPKHMVVSHTPMRELAGIYGGPSPSNNASDGALR